MEESPMVVRAIAALLVMVGLMLLVWLQIRAADTDKYLTVEQLLNRGLKALSWDRHYAMPLDFCIIPPTVALSIFLCGMQWTTKNMIVAGLLSAGVIVLCVYVLWIGGNEAHVHDGKPTPAGYQHGVYAAIAAWAFIMVLCFTPQPEPVLLLILCIVVPAFFFVGQHMFLGMINFRGSASTFSGNPLSDIKGWAVLVVITGAVWWRTYALIPSSFWESLS
jgi:hypothetical protein